MGMDITLSIFKNKECIAENIFDGRNSTWFNNMMGGGDDEIYDSLPLGYGISDETSAEWAKLHEDPGSYFERHYINVKDFKDWFLDKRPDIDAGWVTRYEAWAYKHKGIQPECLQKRLWETDVIEDMKFIEVTNKYDCSAWLYCYLEDNEIPEDACIQYCFDC
jgi:hypothetical protein